MKRQMKKAFTLIELLVVITIIGILAVGGAAVFTTQIQKARDSTRTTDIAAIKTALEQYTSDKNLYPSASVDTTNSNPFDIKGYMQKIPKDPKSGEQVGNGSGSLDYFYAVGRQNTDFDSFELSVAFENAGNTEMKSKASGKQTDLGDDDYRYELYNGTGGVVNTKGNKKVVTTLSAWAQTGTNLPANNSCVGTDSSDGSVTTCNTADGTATTGNTTILVIR